MLVIIHFSRRYLVVRSTSCATIYECNKIRSATKRAETSAVGISHEKLKSEKSLLLHRRVPLTLDAHTKYIFFSFWFENQKSRCEKTAPAEIGRDVKG
jgi:hypothetical protein